MRSWRGKGWRVPSLTSRGPRWLHLSTRPLDPRATGGPGLLAGVDTAAVMDLSRGLETAFPGALSGGRGGSHQAGPRLLVSLWGWRCPRWARVPSGTWRERRGDMATEREHGHGEGHGEGTRPRRGTLPRRGDTAPERDMATERGHSPGEGHGHGEGTQPQRGRGTQRGARPRRGTQPQRGVWSWEACSALSSRGSGQGLDAAPPTPTHSFATDEGSGSHPP